MFDSSVVEPAVNLLAELAGDGRALELGIGTGRIALPLANRGIRVQGIDLSKAMIGRLREKPGGEAIPVTIGDFSSPPFGGSFRLTYLVFNTIMNLTTQEAQVSCFKNVATHLEPGGYFVVEVMLPDLQRLPFGETIKTLEVGEERWSFDEYDIPRQGLISHSYSITNGRCSHSSAAFRYVWPAELDLMAELAGMHLHARWGSWAREPLTRESHQHVSVWQKDAIPA